MVIFIVAGKDGIGLAESLVHLGVLDHHVQIDSVLQLLKCSLLLKQDSLGSAIDA